MQHLLSVCPGIAVVHWNAMHVQNAACEWLLLQVKAALRGDAAMPWKGVLTGEVSDRLGALEGPVLAMLSRDPSLRPSMASVHDSIKHMERDGQTFYTCQTTQGISDAE